MSPSDGPEMKIGIASPISLGLLSELLDGCPRLPEALAFGQAAWITQALVHREHEVAVFALAPDFESTQTYRGNGWEIYVAPYRARRRSRDLFQAERRELVQAMSAARCDVIHAWWGYEFAWAALASGRPTVTSFHDWAPAVLRHVRDPYRAVRLVMAARTLASRSRFTAVSPYIAARIRSWTGREAAVIPNAVPDGAGFHPPLRSPGRSGCQVILAVNNGWSRLKNVSALIEAFAIVHSTCHDTQLILVGHGFESGGSAEAWAQSRHLDRGIEFRGFVERDRLPDLMREAALFVHPSLEEACCVAIMEALASGLPVIGGDGSGGVPWMLDGGRAGVLTDVRNPLALANAMIDVLDDVKLRTRLAEEGPRIVRERFSIEKVVSDYESQYTAALAEYR